MTLTFTSNALSRNFAILAGLLGVGLWLKLSWINSSVGSDFIQDYFAAVSLRNGYSVYHGAVPKLASNIFPGYFFENFHPPFNAILFLGLSYLPFRAAFLLWSIFSLASYTVIFRASILCPNWWFYNFVGLLWYPFIFAIGTGQSSIVLAALVVGSFRALELGRDRWAGFMLAVAAQIKLFPLLIVLYLLISRRRAALLTWLFSFGLLTLITIAVVGWYDVSSYIFLVSRLDVENFSTFILNSSFLGIVMPLIQSNSWVTPLGSIHQSAAFLIAMGITGIVAALSVMNASYLLNRRYSFDAFNLIVIGMILASPISWAHIFPVLLPALTRYWEDESRPFSRPLLLIIAILLSLPDVYIARWLFRLSGGAPLSLGQFLIVKLPTLAVILLGCSITFGRCMVCSTTSPGHGERSKDPS